jgi:hypothetical protein
LVRDIAGQVDAINIPEIYEESRQGTRRMRLSERIEPRVFAQAIQAATHMESVINRVTVRESPEYQRRWLRETCEQYGVRNLILVGGESHTVEYPGPNVLEAAALAADPLPWLARHGVTATITVHPVHRRFGPHRKHEVGEALLAPHRSYLRELRPLFGKLKGIAHITGGGALVENVPRMLPQGLAARLDRSAWEVPAIFRLIQREGNVAEEEMWRTYNMGLGIVFAVDPSDVAAVRAALPEALVVGEVARASCVSS